MERKALIIIFSHIVPGKVQSVMVWYVGRLDERTDGHIERRRKEPLYSENANIAFPFRSLFSNLEVGFSVGQRVYGWVGYKSEPRQDKCGGKRNRHDYSAVFQKGNKVI